MCLGGDAYGLHITYIQRRDGPSGTRDEAAGLSLTRIEMSISVGSEH